MHFDPTSTEFLACPYPSYDKLRNFAPVFFWEPREMWLLTRHEDCKRMLSDQRLGHVVPDGDSIVFQNPPNHTRLRSLVSRAFTPRMIEQYRVRTQTITHQLLDDVQADGQMDLIAKFAYLLPVTVIAEVLGVPVEDHVLFRQWSKQLIKSLDLVVRPDLQESIRDTIDALTAYLGDIVAERRVAPGNDLISVMVAAEEAGDRLSERELYATCRTLLIAGHETTVNLIGNGVLALLRNRDQRRLLQKHPELVGSAVEELLRYDSPVQFVSRTVLDEVTCQGHTIRQGQVVGFLLGAANRDPEIFGQPNQLNLTRQNNAHLAFGYGIHYCLGAALARLESQIAISTLFQRMPKLMMAADTPTYQDNFAFRGLEKFPVSW